MAEQRNQAICHAFMGKPSGSAKPRRAEPPRTINLRGIKPKRVNSEVQTGETFMIRFWKRVYSLRRVPRLRLWIAAYLLGYVSICGGQPTGPGIPHTGLDASMLLEARTAVNRAARRLTERQRREGSWSSDPFITAYVMRALVAVQPRNGSPGGEAVNRGARYLLSRIGGDGCVVVDSRSPSPVHLTAAAVIALAKATPVPDSEEALLLARDYLVSAQSQDKSRPAWKGGFSRFPGSPPDLITTQLVLEALLLTAPPAPGGLLRSHYTDYLASLRFIARCQHPQTQRHESSRQQKGWFAETPLRERESADETSIRGAGLRTCAALSILIPSDLFRNSKYVQAGIAWMNEHHTITPNREVDSEESLYRKFYYSAKGFNAVEEKDDPIDSAPHSRWRRTITRRLLSLQGGDGMWIAQHRGGKQSDNEMPTAYALLTLDITTGE